MMDRGTISSEVIQKLHDYFNNRQPEIESFIRELVADESPSGDERGSRSVVERLATAAKRLRCVSAVDKIDVLDFGQHLVVRAFQNRVNEGNVMLVGHTDTVHARGSLEQRPLRVEHNRLYGPGTFDMKANCALAIEILRAFDELGVTPKCSLTLVLTCDEEVGSFSGWPLMEKIAKTERPKVVLVMEPPASGGRVKTGRKGTGIFAIKVAGRASHAGLEPEKGASAILELARQTERLHALNQSGSGITVNVGVVRGGTRSNVVAAEAEGEIDVRFSTDAESQEIQRILTNLQPIDERTKVFVTGGINRPPLERTPAIVELFERARAIAGMMDFDLGETQVGGASDGNFLAAMGIPVLDGLGISGDGAHAIHEHIELDDIPRRGALLAGLIATL
jgi:glutamate carboxypeptidase